MCLKYFKGISDVPFRIPTPLQIKIYIQSSSYGTNMVMIIYGKDDKSDEKLTCVFFFSQITVQTMTKLFNEQRKVNCEK